MGGNGETGERQRTDAARLRGLHAGPSALVLANAWDAVTARLVEEAGFAAIATSSCAVAWSLGYRDGEAAPLGAVLDGVRRMVRVVSVPVTVDLVSGYGDTPAALAETVRQLVAAGAAGVNLEDAPGGGGTVLRTASEQARRLTAARRAAAAAGADLVVNARTDVYLRRAVPEEARLAEAVARANAYRRAGADCLFVPGVADADTIEALCRGIDGPVNIMAGARTPPVAELERLGVRRVSIGGGLAERAMGAVRDAARALREHGTFDAFTNGALGYPELDALFPAGGSGG